MSGSGLYVELPTGDPNVVVRLPVLGMPTSESIATAQAVDASLRLTRSERWALEYSRNCCRIVATPLGMGDEMRASEAADIITKLLAKHKFTERD